MKHPFAFHKTGRAAAGALCLFLCLALLCGCGAVTSSSPASQNPDEALTSTTFAMDTMVSQTFYNPAAQSTMQQVNVALAQASGRLSLFEQDSDIARINAAAGQGGVEIAPETARLLQQAQLLSAQSEGAFALTIAPLTLAWGVTSDTPRVVPPEERPALTALVDDTALHIEGNMVSLANAGMGIDLGGIAKGYACDLAVEIYEQNDVQSVLLSMGGSTIYARGTKPDGSPYRIGFRNPNAQGDAYLASFTLQDMAVAVSGGYERYFEADGERYIHILDPRTGAPAQSDIASVGVVCQSGTEADFYSTTLFVWGKQRALQYMRSGGACLLLDNEGVLYVSESLREGFVLHKGEHGVTRVEFVEGG